MYQTNLHFLKQYYPDLYKKIYGIEISNCQYEVLMTKTNHPTLRINRDGRHFLIHSSYNPVKEAELFAQQNFEGSEYLYIIYGFGFGYHIREFLKLDSRARFLVLESNTGIFRYALESVDLSDILQESRIHLIVEDDMKKLAVRLGNALVAEKTRFIIHQPSLQAIPEALMDFKYLLEDYRVNVRALQQEPLLVDNFHHNIKNFDACVDVLFGRFKNSGLILVSSGPSLDKNKHLLVELKGKAVVMAVDSAVKPLLQAGVKPDIIIVTDPNDIVYNHLGGIDIVVPLIALSTCNKKVLENYRGPRLIAFQQGFNPAEEYALQKNHKIVQTGGSVATTALDIAIQFGCNPIVFVGQDLALTNGKTHADASFYSRKVTETNHLRIVYSSDGQQLFTTKTLYIFKRWMENRISQCSGTTFINATEGGANINGARHLSLRKVMDEVFADKRIDFDISHFVLKN